MGALAEDIIQYNNKTSLLRLYLGYYDEEDLYAIFDAESITDILDNYDYTQIRSRLINTKTLEGDELYNIGDIVEVDQPVLRDGSYRHIFGLIIGKHIEFDEYNKNIYPIYHYSYDVLCIFREYIDGYSYEIRKLEADEMITTEYYPVENIEEILKKFAFTIIERPL